MSAEFDVMAGWTREAVRELGDEHALPAACQGSASPAALDWLAAACAVRAGTRLLDVGGGTGGPAAWAAREHGARPLLVEPMLEACRAARSLFGLPVVAGSGEALPVATGALRAVWCLGVLCTTACRPAVLGELRRVLAPDGALGLLVFVRRAAVAAPPEGNHFPGADELTDQLTSAGLAVTDRLGLSELPPPPGSWAERADRVQEVVARDHATDPRHREAVHQQRRIAELLSDGTIAGELLRARPAGLTHGA